MPYGYTLQTLTGQPNSVLSFTKPAGLYSWVAGLQYFELSYGSKARQIDRVELHLEVANLPQVLQVTVQAKMGDDDSHELDSARSTVTVAMICYVDADGSGDDPMDTLANLSTIADGQSSGPVQLNPPGGRGAPPRLDLQAAFLSGFDVEVGDLKDIKVHEWNTSAAYEPAGQSTARITSSIRLGAGGSTTARSTSIDGGLLALRVPALLSAQSTGPLQADQHVVDLLPKLQAAVVLITGFSMSFGSGEKHHPIQTFAVGAESAELGPAGDTVVLTTAKARMTDGGDHHQSDGQSSDSLLVVGVPAQGRAIRAAAGLA